MRGSGSRVQHKIAVDDFRHLVGRSAQHVLVSRIAFHGSGHAIEDDQPRPGRVAAKITRSTAVSHNLDALAATRPRASLIPLPARPVGLAPAQNVAQRCRTSSGWSNDPSPSGSGGVGFGLLPGWQRLALTTPGLRCWASTASGESWTVAVKISQSSLD